MFLKVMTKMMILILCAGMILVFTGDISSAAMGYKGPKDIPNQKKSTKSITGEISVIQSTYMGVITYRDKIKGEETEMLFILDEDVNYKKKSLAELQEGAQVKIVYENITKPDPEDESNDLFVRRITKEIQFLRAKSTSLKAGKK